MTNARSEGFTTTNMRFPAFPYVTPTCRRNLQDVFCPHDGRKKLLRDTGTYLPSYTASHPNPH